MTTRVQHRTTHKAAHHHARHTAVAKEAEGLLDRLAHSAVGEEAKELVNQLRNNLTSLKEAAEAVQEYVEDDFHAMEKKIQRNPWSAVGLTAASGVIVGFFLARRWR